ncbi:MAG: hypothetical protein KAU58_03305 [Candidatus Omnitrophica bacterium]|nr:hypothetical protein [Candidatus Omnitrophota bacterium]
MDLKNIDIVRSPIDINKVRLTAEVHYDARGVSPELYWFEVDKMFEKYLSSTANPWLACLMPLASFYGEPLRLCLPVDGALYDNMQELQQLWKRSYPHMHVVPVEASAINCLDYHKKKSVASFFSGGIDSFFTALRYNCVESAFKTKIDDLLCVWGFDIPLKNKKDFFHLKGTLEKVSEKIHANFISVATNLRETRLKTVGWGPLYFGSALASVGLALEKKYSLIYIASNGEGWNMAPWGSHPLSDPLFSTSNTRICHDGFMYTRVEKTEYISKFEVARHGLHTCWKNSSYDNCSICDKCYRTMSTLDALGVLHLFPTFKKELYDTSKLGHLYIKNDFQKIYYEDIKRLATKKGRRDIVASLNSSFGKSKLLNIAVPIARYITNRLGKGHVFLRWLSILKNKLFGTIIT